MSENINFSLSSEEDVRDFLNKLGYVYEGKDRNDELFSVYYDFNRLIKLIPSNKYIIMFHDVQVGKYSMNREGETVVETCSKLLGMNTSEYEEQLDRNIKDLVRFKRKEWKKYIEKKYGTLDFSKHFNK